ncbi:hypothetical protein GN956_G20710 [Arapaima gigas]
MYLSISISPATSRHPTQASYTLEYPEVQELNTVEAQHQGQLQTGYASTYFLQDVQFAISLLCISIIVILKGIK